VELAHFTTQCYPNIHVIVTSGLALTKSLPKGATFMPKPWRPPDVLAKPSVRRIDATVAPRPWSGRPSRVDHAPPAEDRGGYPETAIVVAGKGSDTPDISLDNLVFWSVAHAASEDDKSRKNFHLPEVTL
jgi:hypothetical protein